MSNFNVQNENWLEIAFEHRNKAYGAYQLRKESDATTIKAMLLTFGFIAFGIGLFSFTTPEIKSEDVINCPITPLEKLTLVRITPQIEPKSVIKKGTDKPKLNITPNKVPPVVVARTEVKPIVEPINPDYTTPFNPNGSENGNPGPIGNPLGNSTTPSTTNTQGSGTGTSVYKGVLGTEASFPGGINKFRTFIAENYKVPNSFDQEVLFIEMVFVIEKDGSMTDIRMVSKGDKALEKEAIRVLTSMKKKWTPGRVNGEVVRSEKRLPIQINLLETE
ncbi:energy transducer TonB [Flavobacterium sp.]|uniref:energy transducer TonB n=1 Tax=Flavobacterium sp. TaxID=239 RepID=UPI003340E308